MSARVWTHGTWRVGPGREDAFVEAWTTLVRDASAELGGDVEPPTLLRDRDDPTTFLSFGPWPDLDAVERFRGSEAFARAGATLRDVLTGFDARTLDEVVAP